MMAMQAWLHTSRSEARQHPCQQAWIAAVLAEECSICYQMAGSQEAQFCFLCACLANVGRHIREDIPLQKGKARMAARTNLRCISLFFYKHWLKKWISSIRSAPCSFKHMPSTPSAKPLLAAPSSTWAEEHHAQSLFHSHMHFTAIGKELPSLFHFYIKCRWLNSCW